MSGQRKALGLALVIGLSTGCLFDTSDDVKFVPADSGAVDSDVADADAADTGGVDSDTDSPDLAGRPVCDGAPEPVGTPSCSPITDEGCGIGRFCDVVVTAGGDPPTFGLDCRIEGLAIRRGGVAGDACNDNSGDADYAPCKAGHRCVSGTCYRYCRFGDGAGCRAGESCQPWFPTDQITHFGLCVNTCGDLAAP